MKKCNKCSEEILDDAIKCRFCHELVDFSVVNEYKWKLNTNIKIDDNKKNSRINRVLIIIILLLLLFILLYVFNTKKELNKDFDQEPILKSVVKIQYTDLDDNDWIWSWIMFSKDWLVLTNNHVIQDEKDGESNWKITVCILKEVWKLPVCDYEWKLIIRNATLDLALIKINNYTTDNYVRLFDGSSITTALFWKTINIYGYPLIWWEKVTITKWIVSWFDVNNNIKTDAEVNGWNSWWWAFIWNTFIWIPSSFLADEWYWKISYIISKNKIYSWIASFLKAEPKTEYNSKDFVSTNIMYKWNNILRASSFDTPDYKEWTKVCIDEFWSNSYYTWEYSIGSYMCDCNDWFEFWWDDYDTCVFADVEK